jgi:peptidyl-prolyl cis-trans isomerase C
MISITPRIRLDRMVVPPRRRMISLLTALALPVVVAVPACAQSNDPVVARVNGTDIKTSDLAIAEEEIGQNMPPMPPDGKRDYLVRYVSDMILVAKAAEDKKITEDAEFKRRLAYVRNKLLMESLLHAEAKAAVTDAAMQKVYADATKQMSGEQEVRARHILVETEDEAKAIAAELKKGTDFAELAKQKSKDPGAAAEGGDLGYFTKDQMVPEFAETAFKLDKGQLSDPVKSQFGWHVIKVEDKRERPVPPFEQVKDQIQTFVMRRAQSEVITKLREGAKIERLDAKPAQPQKN